MPSVLTFSYEDARVIIWEITENTDQLRRLLNDPDEKGWEAISTEKRKLEYLAVRVALKTVSGAVCKVSYDKNGKPYPEDGSFHISISHSGKWVAVMIHPDRLVGIDIEMPTEKVRRVAARFLGHAEMEGLENGNDLRQLQIAWSAKEAMYKIIGNEAVDFANHLRVFPFTPSESGSVMVKHLPTERNYSLHYIQNTDYTLVFGLDSFSDLEKRNTK